MDHLNLEFERFDVESRTQMFLDRESCAAVSEHQSMTSDDDFSGSIGNLSNSMESLND